MQYDPEEQKEKIKIFYRKKTGTEFHEPDLGNLED